MSALTELAAQAEYERSSAEREASHAETTTQAVRDGEGTVTARSGEETWLRCRASAPLAPR